MLLSLKEAAEKTGLNIKMLRKMCSAEFHNLPYIDTGHKWLIEEKDLFHYLESLKVRR